MIFLSSYMLRSRALIIMTSAVVLLQISANLEASLGNRMYLDGNYSLELAHAIARRGRGMPRHALSDLKPRHHLASMHLFCCSLTDSDASMSPSA